MKYSLFLLAANSLSVIGCVTVGCRNSDLPIQITPEKHDFQLLLKNDSFTIQEK